MPELKLFSGRANPELSKKIASFLNIDLSGCQLSTFPDGELHCLIDDVRGRDVFLIQPTCPPVNDNLMELLIMIDTCMRASAERITAVIPYFGYARQDRKDTGRVPITAKLVANMLTRAGAHRVLTMDLHAPQIQGFFDLPVDHLYSGSVLNEYFISQKFREEELVIVSPDQGSIKRAVGHAERLKGQLAIIDKRRITPERVELVNIVGGSLEDRIVLMFDDMISTGGSICAAAELVKKRGAREIHVAATHGLFAGRAVEKLRAAPIDSIIVTDTIPAGRALELENLKVLTTSRLLGEAIKRIHQHKSVSSLFGDNPTGSP